MKSYNYKDVLASDSPISELDCSKYPDCTVPDLNIDIYEMLVRQQNGDISSVGGMIRRDAQYSTKEDIEQMRVDPTNDPQFNLITAKYYADAQRDRVNNMLDEDKQTHEEKERIAHEQELLAKSPSSVSESPRA